MSKQSVAAADQPLYDLIVHGPVLATIPDVIARMQAIDALLPVHDGLKWFNQLYLMTTQQVDLAPPGGAWQTPEWLTRLDVVFAGLYFNAIASALAGEWVPRAWKALFEVRYHTGIDRIQFALAGMNAHIDHDLALALLETNKELNVVPAVGSPEAADYLAVNELLKVVLPAALTMLATDTLGVLAQATGRIGQVLALWDVFCARDLAWKFAETLRGLEGLAREVALDVQDGATGAVGKVILAPVAGVIV